MRRAWRKAFWPVKLLNKLEGEGSNLKRGIALISTEMQQECVLSPFFFLIGTAALPSQEGCGCAATGLGCFIVVPSRGKMSSLEIPTLLPGMKLSGPMALGMP